jgi:hypothetical protein
VAAKSPVTLGFMGFPPTWSYAVFLTGSTFS